MLEPAEAEAAETRSQRRPPGGPASPTGRTATAGAPGTGSVSALQAKGRRSAGQGTVLDIVGISPLDTVPRPEDARSQPGARGTLGLRSHRWLHPCWRGRPTGQILDHREPDAGGSRLPRTVCESVGERWRDGAGSLPHLGCAATPVPAPMLARAADGPDFGPCGSLRQASAPTTRSSSRVPAAPAVATVAHLSPMGYACAAYNLEAARFRRRRSALRSDSPPIPPQLAATGATDGATVPICVFIFGCALLSQSARPIGCDQDAMYAHRHRTSSARRTSDARFEGQHGFTTRLNQASSHDLDVLAVLMQRNAEVRPARKGERFCLELGLEKEASA